MSFKPTSTVVVRDFSGNAITVTSGAGLHVIVTSGTITSVANVSGNVVVTSISGNVINTSGQSVSLFSGSNAVTLASGFNTVTQGGLVVRIVAPTVVTGLSGGISLGSGVTPHGIKIKNVQLIEGATISGVLYVGGSGTGLAPFSGGGYPLMPGGELEIKVQNFNSVRVSAGLSGASVAAIGLDY